MKLLYQPNNTAFSTANASMIFVALDNVTSWGDGHPFIVVNYLPNYGRQNERTTYYSFSWPTGITVTTVAE